ncbi:MAG: von Willebrand factor type A domain-containing protein [Planctomycetes bacterium]|nr:von Willebrand factor type A domain-containing protein [Planctomycetota bacterium]
MSQNSPNGSRRRYALPLALAILGGASLGLTGCGGGGTTGFKRGGDAAEASAVPTGEFNKQNAESYGAIVENEFRSPLVAPRSTFSADVNTASYANVRRFIAQQNKLPPRDAVLLAELVNYFPYTYPAPTGDNPVSLTLDIAPCPWEPEHKLARIGVRARDIAPADMPARNLVFLIDTSGSMAGENRLPLVKRALNLLVDTLAERDRVTIVTYAGDAGLKLTPTPGNRKRAIRDVVNSLGAGGGTNGEGGIRLAYEMARRTFIEGGANRVILCTDGDFNVGVSNQSELRQLIEKERTSGVFLSVLGFGMGNYKDATLKKLANCGNGQHAYIDTIDEARKVFVEQGAALVCVAKDVKFQVDFNPAKVNAYRLIGYENRILKAEDFKNDAKDAGDVGSGHTVTALYEIVPVGVQIDLPDVDPYKYQKPAQGAGPPAGPRNGTNGFDRPGQQGDEWLTVKMRYKRPDGDASKELAAVLKGEGTGRGSEDFRFASAVIEFGLILRDSPYKGGANLGAVIERASGALGADPNGHRKEFVELARRAKGLRERAAE